MLPYITVLIAVVVPTILHCHRMMTEHEEKFRSQREKFFQALLTFIIKWGPDFASVYLVLELMYAHVPFGRTDMALILVLLYAILTLNQARLMLSNIESLKAQVRYMDSSHDLSKSIHDSIRSQSVAIHVLFVQVQALLPKLSPEEFQQMKLKVSEIKSDFPDENKSN